MNRATAIVRTDGRGRDLVSLVEALAGDVTAVEVVLLDDGRPDAALRGAITGLTESGLAANVPVDPRAPIAAWRNAGVAAASSDAVFFVDPGWQPSGEWTASACGALDSGAAIVTSPFRRVSFGTEEIVRPEGSGVGALLGDAEAFHPCTMFVRTVWQELGGFDETLPGLELADFWLRALSRGRAASVLDDVLVTHRPGETRHHRLDLHRTRHLPALTALYHKHRTLFDADPALALTTRDRALIERSGAYREMTARRARAVTEVESLRREIEALTSELRSLGSDRVDWGDLRRTTPVSPDWGADRGKPVDRRYIETFLGECSADVLGDVLEVQEPDYTRAFGGERVTRSDVVDLDPTNPRATFVADLRRMECVPDASYDCFILTQTVHVIDDMRAVIEEAHRILRPGGVLLTTFPCLSRVCLEYGEDGDFWRLTEAGVRNLLEGVFPPEAVTTRCYGNVLTATAFLYGLSCEEIRDDEFGAYDPYHPVLVGARAVKPSGAVRGEAPAVLRARPDVEGSVLAFHRVAAMDRDTHGLCISPAAFRSQMEALASRAKPMPLVELVERAKARNLEPGAVAVTFDDGYLDVLTTASPVLVELGIPATFFLVSEALDRKTPFWWDAIERVFLSGAPIPAELDVVVGGNRHTRVTRTPDERRAAHDALYPDLQRCPPAQRDSALRALETWSGVDLAASGDSRPLTRSEARELASRPGHAIGAHGVHHLALSSQPYETQQREIMESKAALERILGDDVRAFAYPYGDVCDTAASLAAAAGFRVAVTCEERGVGARVHAMRVPRVDGRTWRPA